MDRKKVYSVMVSRVPNLSSIGTPSNKLCLGMSLTKTYTIFGIKLPSQRSL